MEIEMGECACVCVLYVLNGIEAKDKTGPGKKALKHAIDQPFKWSPKTN